jgi:hypothetical protein
LSDGPPPALNIPRTDRSSERTGVASLWSRDNRSRLGRGVAIRNDLPFVPELINRLEHLLRRHLGRIVTNLQQVFFQIDANLLDAWKP